jgi:hypothetical protein
MAFTRFTDSHLDAALSRVCMLTNIKLTRNQVLRPMLADGSLLDKLIVGGGLQEAIRTPLLEAFRASFQSVLVPQYECAARAMFDQLNSAFNSGIQNHIPPAHLTNRPCLCLLSLTPFTDHSISTSAGRWGTQLKLSLNHTQQRLRSNDNRHSQRPTNK